MSARAHISHNELAHTIPVDSMHSPRLRGSVYYADKQGFGDDKRW